MEQLHILSPPLPAAAAVHPIHAHSTAQRILPVLQTLGIVEASSSILTRGTRVTLFALPANQLTPCLLFVAGARKIPCFGGQPVGRGTVTVQFITPAYLLCDP